MRQFYLTLLGCCCAMVTFSQTAIPVSKFKRTFILLHNITPISTNIGGENGAIVLEQQPTDMDTLYIIRLQAARENFQSTNMLIVSKDTLIELTLYYERDPRVTMYPFHFSEKKQSAVIPNTPAVKQNGISVNPQSLVTFRSSNSKVRRSIKSDGMLVILDNVGMDAADEHLFLRFRVRNTTAVAFSLDYLKFIVHSSDQKTFSNTKQAATDDYPSFLSDTANKTTIQAGEEEVFIYVIDRLPPKRRKDLTVVFQEAATSADGRSLTMKIPATLFARKENISRL
ncbi:uncharacterized protein DUF4138 [Chitinophaga skermanii]|uniref:Uncharacterized protein DUF4138 n=1 Tax=Chitinophaga skermanii TaxID=331697 RepID=A0A327PZ59_9BACT|nr:DUF4138 domain-containing protein [Chitinophaga skermanii]RAI97023.1 uncharacterized protein DUF4138 [Chitinophaga skermanii]